MSQTSHEIQLNGSYNNVEFTAGLYMFEKEHTQDWATGGTFWGVLFGGALSAPGQWELCQDFFEPTYSVACDPTEACPVMNLMNFIIQIFILMK